MRSFRQTILRTRGPPIMPVLAASTPISVITASSCLATNSGGTSWIPETPRVFCAVRAVTALMPYPPSRVIVFRSAWMPAPPPESDPAMVKIRGITIFLLLKMSFPLPEEKSNVFFILAQSNGVSRKSPASPSFLFSPLLLEGNRMGGGYGKTISPLKRNLTRPKAGDTLKEFDKAGGSD